MSKKKYIVVGVGGNWFAKGVRRGLSIGDQVLFWEDIWIGEENLKTTFARLYRVAKDKGCIVANMGYWRDGEWLWKVKWRRSLYQ